MQLKIVFVAGTILRSELYSPVLGPALRRAVGHHRMDMILDGEVLAWDSGRKETVPFGNNGTIARLRQKWMSRMGLCDDRDFGMHAADKDIKSVGPSSYKAAVKGEFDDVTGEECWLVFCAFDILYLNGPGAEEILGSTLSPCITPRPLPGSLIDLDGIERKKLLYRLVNTQENEVEIVETMIVRPNGRLAVGSTYFSSQQPMEEFGIPAHTLDSIECTLRGGIPSLKEIDTKRRHGQSDEEISVARARALEKIYKRTVEDQRLEGLLFKDLAAPYCLGAQSKSLRYWLKFKPDYFNGSAASDLDLVICGAYFASGLRSAGKPSSFLCACVDSEDDELFFPVCKVSAGSMDESTRASLLSRTGFRHESSETDVSIEYGNWFKGDEDRSIPDFVSRRSYQNGNEGRGWRLKKEDYPDLWIRPEQSAVVTLNAGEIVVSDFFSVGLTLRFPRITKLRDGADDKKLHQIENDRSLWAIFQEVMESRTSTENADSVLGSPIKPDGKLLCRFLTEEQFAATRKAKKTRTTKQRAGIPMPRAQGSESQALSGMEFTVLDGNYALESKSIDAHQAEAEGWLNEAKAVKSSMSVKCFIKKNGGEVKLAIGKHDYKTFVIGGRENDARVRNYVGAIENAITRAPELNGRTKKAIDNAALARHPGVVRWTFVYSAVKRWKDQQKEGAPKRDASFQPTILDYLARPRNARQHRQPDNISISDTITLSRALQSASTLLNLASSTPPDDKSQPSWQTIASISLEPHVRWIMSCGPGKTLWPQDGDDASMRQEQGMILYADIYEDLDSSTAVTRADHSLAGELGGRISRPDSEIGHILSVLPLARVMGFRVSPVLHPGVTHVLVANMPEGTSDKQCIRVDMEEEKSYLLDEKSIDRPFQALTKLQKDDNPVGRLLRHLQDLRTEVQRTSKDRSECVIFVAPSFFRNVMWKSE